MDFKPLQSFCLHSWSFNGMSKIKPVLITKAQPLKFCQRTAKSKVCVARTTQSPPSPLDAFKKKTWLQKICANSWQRWLDTQLHHKFYCNKFKSLWDDGSSGTWLVGTKSCRNCEGWKCCLCKQHVHLSVTSAWFEIQLTEAFPVLVVIINPLPS